LGSRHSPCDLGRFRAGLSGFLSLPLQPVFKAGRSPSCGLPPSTKPTNHPSTAPGSAIPSAPLLRFGPLQRATVTGARMTRSFQPPAHSVLRVSHPLDVFLLLQPCEAYFIPAALMGFPQPTLRHSLEPFDSSRATATAFPPQGFPSPHDERVLTRSPLTRFADPFTGAHHAWGQFPGIPTRRASQSFNRRGHGISPGNEPRVPAFPRFATDLHARELETFQPLGYPATFRRHLHRLPATSRPSCPYRSFTSVRPASDLTTNQNRALNM
jgi:hypothetical protein